MTDDYFSRSFQNDLYEVVRLYAEPEPSFPPEKCSPQDCHERLSIEHVKCAARMALTYLGQGEHVGAADFDLESLLRCYVFDPEGRRRMAEIAAERLSLIS
ncbi:hypothetical protein TK49_13060 [Ralstonia mannitolilytica]|uniref:hypothetical protein n=1 Tax=Ralstonia mannitolilytica TaxID=105219 RepID=UPI0005D7BE3B|nr:hypothetical protein [Ralstonia mannitolilytica]AJW45546.1 hypothetical protein TK49_13060 [Ralstonia mannitolilytica]